MGRVGGRVCPDLCKITPQVNSIDLIVCIVTVPPGQVVVSEIIDLQLTADLQSRLETCKLILTAPYPLQI